MQIQGIQHHVYTGLPQKKTVRFEAFLGAPAEPKTSAPQQTPGTSLSRHQHHVEPFGSGKSGRLRLRHDTRK